MKLFIDNEYKCHTTNPDGTFREVETDFFIGKCVEFIEGYRIVPDGEKWVSSDGAEFDGLMISPWKDYSELDTAQREYEREKLADAENALAILLGGETE